MLQKNIALTLLVDISGRLLLILFFYILAMDHLQMFRQLHKASSLLYVITEAVLIFFTVFRLPSQRFSISPFDWTVALLATLLPLWIIPTATPDHLPALVFQCLGVLVTLGGILSLNRSFGLVAAEREIKQGGLYRFVRHPLYAGYTIALVGILLNHTTLYNIICGVTATILQVVRIQREEAFLAQNPIYQRFMKATRWRLIPFVF